MPVNTPVNDYHKSEEERLLTRHLRGGSDKMRKAGKKYLPQEPLESETAYINRLKRSYLVNFYRKTVDKFVGKITRQDPGLLDETPTEIEDLYEDIDNNGNDLPTVIRESLTHAVDDGIVFYFIDSPRDPTRETQDGEEQPQRTFRSRGSDIRNGIRPYVRTIRADDLIGWKFEKINGNKVLTQIRIRETVTKVDPEDEWNEIEVEQIRVVEPFLHVIYEFQKDENGKEDWVIVETIQTDFETIPLVALYTSKIKYMVGEPLFLDLASLNLEHWQSYSDQNNITHVIRVPILFASGFDENENPITLDVGPNSLIQGPPASDMKYVEHTGKAADVGFKQLERLEDAIVRMGAEIVLNKRTGANQTATARAIDKSEADNEMTLISTAVENAWNEVFQFLAEAFGLEADSDVVGGINMNKDFKAGLIEAQDIAQLIALRTSGNISRDTLWIELKRHDVLSEDFDPEAEALLLDKEEEESMERQAESVRIMEEASLDGGGGDDGDEDDD